MNNNSRWLTDLNTDTGPAALRADLHRCCAASAWIEAILGARPYAYVQELYEVSDVATYGLDERGLAEALAAHPRIGERDTSVHAGFSSQEQAGMNTADATTRTRMEDANRRYEAKFGHVYLVRASGLSAAQLLAICLARLDNDRQTERAVVLGELAKIARVRLGQLMEGANT